MTTSLVPVYRSDNPFAAYPWTARLDRVYGFQLRLRGKSWLGYSEVAPRRFANAFVVLFIPSRDRAGGNDG